MLYGRELYRGVLPLCEAEAIDISTIGRTLNKNYLAKLADHLTRETGIEWRPPAYGTSSEKWTKDTQRNAYFSANLPNGARIAIRLDTFLRMPDRKLNVRWYTETSGTAHQRTIAHVSLEDITIADLKSPAKLFPPAQMKAIKDALAGSTETEERYVTDAVNEIMGSAAQVAATIPKLRDAMQKGVIANGMNLMQALEDLQAYASEVTRGCKTALEQLSAAMKIAGKIKSDRNW